MPGGLGEEPGGQGGWSRGVRTDRDRGPGHWGLGTPLLLWMGQERRTVLGQEGLAWLSPESLWLLR